MVCTMDFKFTILNFNKHYTICVKSSDDWEKAGWQHKKFPLS